MKNRIRTVAAIGAAFFSMAVASHAQPKPGPAPDENRFTKTVLSNDLNEPMELAVAPDGRVFFVERGGKYYMYDPTTKRTKLLRDFPVKSVEKYLNGLLGMTIDPNFSKNSFLYFFYTSEANGQHKQLISRFRVEADGNLDLASEKVIIEVPIDLEVSAHTGGSMAWDAHRNLFISTGDNTVPFESNGFAPIDAQPNRLVYDAQRSAGNPNDLRGKILKITVAEDGSYTIPEGNLFPKGTPGTRPEIYVMGCRNPYRISVDTATDIVYWGEIGPDSGTDGPQGPRGYDEFNQAKKAGNSAGPTSWATARRIINMTSGPRPLVRCSTPMVRQTTRPITPAQKRCPLRRRLWSGIPTTSRRSFLNWTRVAAAPWVALFITSIRT